MKFTEEHLKNLLEINMDGGLSDIGKLIGNKNTLFLSRYSASELYGLLEQTGIVKHLEKLGFRDLNVFTDTDGAQVNYLKLYSGPHRPDNMLMDLRVTETRFMPKKEFFPSGAFLPTYDMVVIEWLSLQNAKKEFDAQRPQLPGQTKPGLGLLNHCLNLMFTVARQISKDGFLDIPEHIHAAIMYSKKFKFFDPANEAFVRAILRDLKKYSMSDISWGVITNTIINEATGKPEKYVPSEQIYSASERMKSYFNSELYKNTFAKAYKSKKYSFDYKTMEKLRKDILKTKIISDL